MGYLLLVINKGTYFNYHDEEDVLLLFVARREDLAVSTRKMTEEAAQVGAGPEWEGQRKEESAESSKPGKVVPTGPAREFGLGGKGSGRGVW